MNKENKQINFLNYAGNQCRTSPFKTFYKSDGTETKHKFNIETKLYEVC